jgi:two-component system cell cycle sensor histidine kinase/response regulator CckA
MFEPDGSNQTDKTEKVNDSRRAGEEGHRLGQAGLSELFASNPLPMWIYDPSTLRFLEVNNAAQKVYGYSRDEFLAMTIADIRPAADIPKLADNLKRERVPFEQGGEWRHQRKDGVIFDVEITSHAFDFDRQSVVLVMGHDVTARKEIERALINSERRLRAVAESAREGIVTADATGAIVFWNPAASELFGYDEKEILGRPLTLLMPERFRAAHSEGLARHVSTREARVIGKTVELHGLTKEGTEFPIELSLSAWTLDEALFFTGIIRDVSARQQLEQQLRQAQKMDAVGQLAGGVAHDFNNLLTVILGTCELLLEGMSQDDPRQDDILEIQKAGASATALTRQLLAFSRKQMIEPAVLDLNSVIADVGRMLKRVIGEDVELELRLHPGLELVKADRGQIEQILMNLALNARDAMAMGGRIIIETGSVVLDDTFTRTHQGAAPGRHVTIAVIDTGTGMTPEVQARLFEPFFTTKPTGKGTGLGLASVYGIVKQNSGSIWVDSDTGKGTTVTVFWPATGESASAVERPSERRTTGSETILIVEDNPALLRLASRTLVQCGYRVVAAANAQEALKAFEAAPAFDLILTDVILPGMSGPALASELAARRPGLAVVFMSGYADETVDRHGLAEASAPLLQKPFTSMNLARTVRQALDAAARA